MPDYEIRLVPWPDDQDADDEYEEDVCPECGCHFCDCPSDDYDADDDGPDDVDDCSALGCDMCRQFFRACAEEPPCAECALSEDRRSQDVHAEPEPGAADYEPPVPEDDVPF